MRRKAPRERDANSFLTKIQTSLLVSLEKSRKAFSLLLLGRDCYESRLRRFEIVRRHSRHDSRRLARISGPINHNYVNSGPGTACVRACVRACRSRALKASTCVREPASRGWGRSAVRNATTHHDKNTAHRTTGDKPPPPSCRRARNGCIIHPLSPSPHPPAASAAESRLRAESFLKIHPPGPFAEFARVQQNNPRGDCPLSPPLPLSFRAHRRIPSRLPLVSFRAVLFSCSYKLPRERRMTAERSRHCGNGVVKFFRPSEINVKITQSQCVIEKKKEKKIKLNRSRTM